MVIKAAVYNQMKIVEHLLLLLLLRIKSVDRVK